MLLEEFNQLNLNIGDRVRVTYDYHLDTREWKTEEITQKWVVTEIKKIVLSPSKTELCLCNYDGGFLPISSIKRITKMKNSKFSPPASETSYAYDKYVLGR